MAKTKRKEAPATVGLTKAKPVTEAQREARAVNPKAAREKFKKILADDEAKLSVAKSVHPKHTSNITPTVEIASELQAAFDHFNATLFDGVTLPQCILSLARLKKAAGMFWPKRWVRDRSKVADRHEIAVDPIFLRRTDDKFALSVIAHEMVHCLIEEQGHGPKRAYHCKRWAAAMKAIGLQPVAMAKGARVEGKETGPNCTHDVVKGGEFDIAATALLDKGFKFSWAAVPEPEKVKKEKKKKAGVKVKYTCSCCENAVWGKGGMKFTCQDGGEDFVQQGGDEGDDE